MAQRKHPTLIPVSRAGALPVFRDPDHHGAFLDAAGRFPVGSASSRRAARAVAAAWLAMMVVPQLRRRPRPAALHRFNHRRSSAIQ